MCKSWCEFIIGVVILVVAAWPKILGVNASTWVIIIAAAALIIHSFGWDKCFSGEMMAKSKRR